jgi:hypothetical protein
MTTVVNKVVDNFFVSSVEKLLFYAKLKPYYAAFLHIIHRLCGQGGKNVDKSAFRLII